jgi:hypothetical protein
MEGDVADNAIFAASCSTQRARAHDLRTPKHKQGLYAMAMDVGVTDTAPARGFGRLRGCG